MNRVRIAATVIPLLVGGLVGAACSECKEGGDLLVEDGD